MKVRKYIMAFCVLAVLFASAFLVGRQQASAKAGSKTYTEITSKKQKIGSYTFHYVYDENTGLTSIYVNGKNHAFVIKKASVRCYTNGTYLYYSTDSSKKNVIYKMTLSNGKKKKVLSGNRLVVCGGYDKYLYYGIDQEIDGLKIYCYNQNTKKKRFMQNWASRVLIGKKMVVITLHSGDFDNYMLYGFKLDGSGKKELVKAARVEYKNNHFYYILYRWDGSGKDMVRLYRADNNFTNRKPLTKYIAMKEMEKVFKKYKFAW